MDGCLSLRVLAVCLWLVPAGYAQAHEHAFSSQEEVIDWVNAYHVQPEPRRFSEALRIMSEEGLLGMPAAQPLIAGFMSGVFVDNPDQVAVWLRQAGRLPADHRSLVLLGLWHTGQAEAAAIVKAAIAGDPAIEANLGFLSSRVAQHVTALPLEQGHWVLNTLWGYYLATGDERAVIRVIQVLPWVEHMDRPGHMSIGRAAYWSLAVNAARQPDVLRICEAQLATQPEKAGRLLRKVITQARQPKADSGAWGLSTSRR